MALKLFVGGLPYSTTNDELQALFAEHGAVENAFVIMDRDSGRSKGFGFVEMPNDDEAKAAIEKLNGTDLGGRSIIVNEAREKEDRGPRPQRSGGGGGNRDSGPQRY